MESGLSAFAIILLAVVIVVSVLVVYATKRHKRYAAAHKPLLQKYPMLEKVALPSLTEQDVAYREAEAWLAECKARGIKTWLAGQSRASMLHLHKMYPWETSITFHYVSPTRGAICPPVLSVPKSFSGSSRKSHIKVRRDAMPPAHLRTGTFGTITDVPYAVLPGRTLRVRPKAMTLPRRDVLDWFRYPPAMSDTFVVEVAEEI
jgi:hypothetical protein